MSRRSRLSGRALPLLAAVLALAGCGSSASASGSSAASAPAASPIDRAASVPSGAIKMTPQNDHNPVRSLSAEFEQPVPLPGGVNTAGAEDSPFITPDGDTLYFFFTPDVAIPAEKQLLDGVTGIWVSRNTNGQWSAGERVILQDQGKLALDGCEYVSGEVMWFCSTREGYSGIHWFTARLRDGRWQDWQLADFGPGFEVGELHMTRDGHTVYFASARPGGKGGLDIWVSTRIGDGKWGEPVDLAAVNSASSEGWPALSPDETELWISRDYALWRSKLVDGTWQAPVKMFSPLAGEATLDAAGNVYFVHHYYDGDRMIEADIYVSYPRAAP
jgi:hypothetical protein